MPRVSVGCDESIPCWPFLWWRRGRERKRTLHCCWPFLRWERTQNTYGEQQFIYSFLFWLLRLETAASTLLVNLCFLFTYYHTKEETGWQLLLVMWYHKTPGRINFHFLCFVNVSWNRSKSNKPYLFNILWLVWFCRRQDMVKWRLIGPFWSLTDPNNPQHHGWGILPLFISLSTADKQIYHVLWPFCGYRERRKEQQKEVWATCLFSAGFRADCKSWFTLHPLIYYERRVGEHSLFFLIPFVFIGQRHRTYGGDAVNSSFAVVFPLIFYFTKDRVGRGGSPTSSKRTLFCWIYGMKHATRNGQARLKYHGVYILLTIYKYKRRYDDTDWTSFYCILLYLYSSSRGVRQVLLFPLFFFRKRKESVRFITLLGWYLSDNDSLHCTMVPLWYFKHEYGAQRILFCWVWFSMSRSRHSLQRDDEHFHDLSNCPKPDVMQMRILLPVPLYFSFALDEYCLRIILLLYYGSRDARSNSSFIVYFPLYGSVVRNGIPVRRMWLLNLFGTIHYATATQGDGGEDTEPMVAQAGFYVLWPLIHYETAPDGAYHEVRALPLYWHTQTKQWSFQLFLPVYFWMGWAPDVKKLREDGTEVGRGNASEQPEGEEYVGGGGGDVDDLGYEEVEYFSRAFSVVLPFGWKRVTPKYEYSYYAPLFILPPYYYHRVEDTKTSRHLFPIWGRIQRSPVYMRHEQWSYALFPLVLWGGSKDPRSAENNYNGSWCGVLLLYWWIREQFDGKKTNTKLLLPLGYSYTREGATKKWITASWLHYFKSTQEQWALGLIGVPCGCGAHVYLLRCQKWLTRRKTRFWVVLLFYYYSSTTTQLMSFLWLFHKSFALILWQQKFVGGTTASTRVKLPPLFRYDYHRFAGSAVSVLYIWVPQFAVIRLNFAKKQYWCWMLFFYQKIAKGTTERATTETSRVDAPGSVDSGADMPEVAGGADGAAGSGETVKYDSLLSFVWFGFHAAFALYHRSTEQRKWFIVGLVASKQKTVEEKEYHCWSLFWLFSFNCALIHVGVRRWFVWPLVWYRPASENPKVSMEMGVGWIFHPMLALLYRRVSDGDKSRTYVPLLFYHRTNKHKSIWSVLWLCHPLAALFYWRSDELSTTTFVLLLYFFNVRRRKVGDLEGGGGAHETHEKRLALGWLLHPNAALYYSERKPDKSTKYTPLLFYHYAEKPAAAPVGDALQLRQFALLWITARISFFLYEPKRFVRLLFLGWYGLESKYRRHFALLYIVSPRVSLIRYHDKNGVDSRLSIWPLLFYHGKLNAWSLYMMCGLIYFKSREAGDTGHGQQKKGKSIFRVLYRLLYVRRDDGELTAFEFNPLVYYKQPEDRTLPSTFLLCGGFCGKNRKGYRCAYCIRCQ